MQIWFWHHYLVLNFSKVFLRSIDNISTVRVWYKMAKYIKTGTSPTTDCNITDHQEDNQCITR